MMLQGRPCKSVCVSEMDELWHVLSVQGKLSECLWCMWLGSDLAQGQVFELQ